MNTKYKLNLSSEDITKIDTIISTEDRMDRARELISFKFPIGVDVMYNFPNKINLTYHL